MIDNRFGVVATAVSQAELSSPLFAEALESWRALFRRVVVVIGSGTTLPLLKKVAVVRVPTLDPTLRDVVYSGVFRQDRITPVMALVDPFCILRRSIYAISTINKRRNIDKAWVVTALAVVIEKGDVEKAIETSQFEMDGLRLMISTENIWTLILRQLDAAEPIPFSSPVWGGWLANWAQAGTPRIAHEKYHDLSELRPVAIRTDTRSPVSTIGYGPLVFNPPLKSWTRGL